ncbi:MAG: type II toxin-antitoxin system VapC family toxin [Gammaproteobacteria bacterium]|nr:type II toxin-antitoxin system VapC family toxin [Gammaproteobacteria bacterium]
MATQVNSYVLDACALIAYLRGEPGGDTLRDWLRETERRFFMHAVNLGEVYYDTLRTCGKQKAVVLFADIAELPIEIIWTLDQALLEAAGRYKTAYRMSYADSFVLALAEQQAAAVISTDHHEFDAVEVTQTLRFCWLR